MIPGGGRGSRSWWRRSLAPVVGAVCLVALLAGCGADGATEGAVTTPLPTAADPPAATALAYLQAWSRDDESRMRELTTESFWRKLEGAVKVSTTFRDVTVTHSRPLPKGDPSRAVDAKGYAEVEDVHFEAMIRQRPVATWKDGRHPWGFQVVRNRADERWLIASQGLG